jgi:hypothetical protein
MMTHHFVCGGNVERYREKQITRERSGVFGDFERAREAQNDALSAFVIGRVSN